MLKALSSETKWRIIEILSKGDKTPTAIAGKLRKSLSNICLHLAELETLKIIKKTGVTGGKTRPYTKYTLDKGFVFLIEAIPNKTRKIFLEVDENLQTHLNIWSIPQKEFHYYVEMFWWELQEYLDDIESVVIFGSVAKGNARTDSDIDALILAKKNIRELEKKFAAKIIGPRKKGKMMMAQVFTPEDFENALKEGSNFAKEVVSSMIIIYDPNRILERIDYELKKRTS